MQLLYIRSFNVYPVMIGIKAKIPDATILHAGAAVKACFMTRPVLKLKRASAGFKIRLAMEAFQMFDLTGVGGLPVGFPKLLTERFFHLRINLCGSISSRRMRNSSSMGAIDSTAWEISMGNSVFSAMISGATPG
jgi:hypothetical protein